ncbi:MAG: hypothetical protein ACKN9W_14315 [Methylococcus sp.]
MAPADCLRVPFGIAPGQSPGKPARLTVFCYALRGDCSTACRAGRRHGSRWQSPTSGSVMAIGAFGLRPGAPAVYRGQPADRAGLGQMQPAQTWDSTRGFTRVQRALWPGLGVLILGGLIHA